jgi:hypothetical protein
MHYCVQIGHIALALPLLSFIFFLALHISNLQTDSHADRQYQLACLLCCFLQLAKSSPSI